MNTHLYYFTAANREKKISAWTRAVLLWVFEAHSVKREQSLEGCDGTWTTSDLYAAAAGAQPSPAVSALTTG